VGGFAVVDVVVVTDVHVFSLSAYVVDATVMTGLSRHRGSICVRVVTSSLSEMCCL